MLAKSSTPTAYKMVRYAKSIYPATVGFPWHKSDDS